MKKSGVKKSDVKKYGVISFFCWGMATFLTVICSQSAELEMGNVAKYSIGIVGILFLS